MKIGNYFYNRNLKNDENLFKKKNILLLNPSEVDSVVISPSNAYPACTFIEVLILCLQYLLYPVLLLQKHRVYVKELRKSGDAR